MRIKLLNTSADENGAFPAGSEITVSDREGADMIEKGYAERVEEKNLFGQRETAMVEAPGKAVKAKPAVKTSKTSKK